MILEPRPEGPDRSMEAERFRGGNILHLEQRLP